MRATPVVPRPMLRAAAARPRCPHVELPEGVTLVGRQGDCDVQLPDPHVSRHHARVEATATGVLLTDLQSTAGTFVNGERLTGTCAIGDGDRVAFGPVEFVLAVPASGATAADATTPMVAAAPPVQLTGRQREVLGMIVEGRTNAEIAARLAVGERAVKAVATRLYRKLDVSNRSEAVARAVEQDLLGR